MKTIALCVVAVATFAIVVPSVISAQSKTKTGPIAGQTLILPKADTALIRTHLTAITKTVGYRNYQNVKLLDQVAAYIRDVFGRYADTVFYQLFQVQGKTYRNVVCRFGTHIDKPVMVVGAHYDVCGDQQGADDNASGVVGLLELARILKDVPLTRPVELVAYTLEEPPFFSTPNMGSAVHAQSLKAARREIYGMAALEMIGYFDDAKSSQGYPVKAMKIVYGTRGNYILLVKRMGYGEFVKRFSAHFDDAETVVGYASGRDSVSVSAPVVVRNLKAPAKIGGIDFSDHLNYWNEGYDALMVTNTAFFRNKNYHQPTDTIETLDIPRMAQVIDRVARALVNVDR